MYEREYYFLSNFSSFAVEWKERVWQTSEHAYQAAKFFGSDPSVVEEIFLARSAHDAKKLAKKYSEPPDWEELKLAVMEDICRHKLEQHPYIEKKLRESAGLDIVEDSPKDSYWGWGLNRDGRNELGNIWMKLRKELLAKGPRN